MRKLKLVSIICCAMLLMSCSDDNNEKQTEDVKETISSETTTRDSEEETRKEINENHSYVPNGKTPEEIIKVVLDGAEYVRVYEESTENEILNDEVLELERYRVVDLDNDGYNEVILYVDNIGHSAMILHCEDGVVYGYEMPYRSCSIISLDGVMSGTSSASDTHFYKMEFDKASYSEVEVEETMIQEFVPDWTSFKWLVNTR